MGGDTAGWGPIWDPNPALQHGWTLLYFPLLLGIGEWALTSGVYGPAEVAGRLVGVEGNPTGL